MTATPDDPLLDAALRVAARYGIARTTMADVAREAGVSRQTLYDRFGDKDGIMAAAIRRMADGICAEVTAAWAGAGSLAARLDAYAAIAVLPVHDQLQALPDAADLLQGKGAAARAAAAEAEGRKRAMLRDMLAATVPGLAARSPGPDEIAAFFESASSRAKMSPDMTRDDLVAFLATLKAATLCLAGEA